ncbi:DsbA family protein [Roseospira visakhapatnamensis]|uniref:Protein-disulfide isomerase n=1 Tax=Roseospira visakhapatnamensis TaxID=390880 RepID=A0A7W6W7Z3_9PROT|nr:DsbA family protein [Roseospira visakhapatnamensis]MBB4264425.1 protein-disulfide isomerase [Roseospira visakhapatnamensis]
MSILSRPVPFPALALMGALLLAGLTAGAPARADDALTDAQRDAVRALVRDTLLDQPEIIAEALEIYQSRQQDAERARVAATLEQHRAAIEAAEAADVLGNPDGAITVVEFSDYQCGYCKRAFPDVASVVQAAGDVRLVIRELPILGPDSVMAARAALAARAQGRYPAFHAALMAMRGGLSEASVMQTARSVGLDVDQLKADMADPALDDRFAETIKLARLLGISGTPAFVVGDEVIPGAISAETLTEVIARAREG